MKDRWLYPEDLNGFPNVINIFEDEGKLYVNIYDLPDNWENKVTYNKGKDGKPSIHDILIAR